MTINELKQEKGRLYDEAKALIDAAESEGRELTEEEQATVDGNLQKMQNIDQSIARQEQLKAVGKDLETSTRQTVEPVKQYGSAAEVPDGVATGTDQRERDPKAGFQDFGEFSKAVRSASMPGGSRDERLSISSAAATSFANEGTGAEGGFLVPPEFSSEVRRLALEEDSFFSMTDQTPVQGNSLRFPADETTPWGTNGVRARWESEGTAATQDQPVLKTKELRLHKLISLVPTTDELLEDTSALETYLTRLMGRSVRWKLNEALVNGSGAGQPMGVANANAKVQVTRDTANEVNAIDVATMYARLLPSATRNAVFLINNDVLPQLITMSISNQPIFVPPNQGIQQSPGGTLLGRPVMFTQTAASVGSTGDVRLVDWSQYATIEKQGGMQQAMSMHLFFDADQMAFRVTFRTDGQPWLDNSVTPNNGSNNLSTIVELN